MTTTQQERPTVVGAPSTTRRAGLMIGMVVIGLLLGLLAGSLLFGSNDVITVDGSALTDRQVEMTELSDDAMIAWQANDAEAVLSYYSENGVFGGTDGEYRVSDGSLAVFVTTFAGASAMEQVGPKILVDDTTMVSFHTYAGSTYTNLMHFTTVGEVLMTRHEVSS